ncbi:hypothetical protein D3C78_595740 [compost metagenome]
MRYSVYLSMYFTLFMVPPKHNEQCAGGKLIYSVRIMDGVWSQGALLSAISLIRCDRE